MVGIRRVLAFLDALFAIPCSSYFPPPTADASEHGCLPTQLCEIVRQESKCRFLGGKGGGRLRLDERVGLLSSVGLQLVRIRLPGVL